MQGRFFGISERKSYSDSMIVMILEDCLRLYEKREGTLVHQITNGIYLCIR